MCLMAKLAELLDNEAKEANVPTFTPENIDIIEARKRIHQYTTKCDITVTLKDRPGESPVVHFIVTVYPDLGYSSKSLGGNTLALAVDAAVMYLQSQNVEPPADPVQEATRILAPLVAVPF